MSESEPWPTHPDGTNKTVGEMEPEERKRVMEAAAKRNRAKFGYSAEKKYPTLSELRPSLDFAKKHGG